jgi:hypothetical protein
VSEQTRNEWRARVPTVTSATRVAEVHNRGWRVERLDQYYCSRKAEETDA